MAIPFDTSEPESGFSDLELLREIIGDARIVALGEATHGTSEFFKMKHRLTEFLVTELGFTIFAIEAPWPATQAINRYVLTGEGSRSQLLRGLTFWTWQTQEVIDLIEWIRDYNTHPEVDQVTFKGFDMQVSYNDSAVNHVVTFVGEIDPEAVSRYEEYYAAFPHEFPINPADADIESASAAVDDLFGHRDEYVAASSPDMYEDVLHTARIIVQSEETVAAGQSLESFETRDRYMAENVTWLLDQAEPGTRIILWAHNGHVGTAPLNLPDGESLHGMGTHLHERYGEDLLVVGFDFFSGTFNAIGQNPDAAPSAETQWVHKIPLPAPESTEYTFAQLGLPRFMLDLRGVQEGTPAGDWLIQERPMWSIGAVFNPAALENSWAITSLPRHFDIVIYFHETTASLRLY